MGLDQYLYARKYISGNNYGRDNQGNFLVLDNPELDTIIEPIGLTRADLDDDMPSVNVSVKVLQWRKANAIHEWFVQNVQRGEDDCKDYYVSREKLEELLSTLGRALDIRKHQGDDMVDPTADETIEDILPTQQGFFFGTYEYDDYYWSEVERTYEAINGLLNNDKFESFDFEYSSSW
jgi:hypothetical protein